MFQNLIIAFILSVFIVALARWRGSLSLSGGIGALLIGTIVFGLGGWQWGVLLGVFFVTSSILSHFKESEKKIIAEDKFDKGHERDFGQTFANGGVGTILALVSVFMPDPVWFVGFIGAMATVTADTWATELGTLSQQSPLLITTGRAVPAGTSGGITLLGTSISLLGGCVIGGIAGILVATVPVIAGILVGGIAGLAGSLFDSFLGATVQQIYQCAVCGKETEKKEHCTQPTQPLRGWSWLTNDNVNLLASIIGAGLAMLIGSLLIL